MLELLIVNLMKKKSILSTSFLFLIVSLFYSCTKQEKFPNEPHIEYISFTKIQNSSGIDDKGVLKISFTDGDGDIGLSNEDTTGSFDKNSIYYYNFFITYYEKQHGQFVVVLPPVTFNSRIPVIKSIGNNNSIKGEIEIEMLFNNPFSVYDTIKFDASIADRALHVSNVISVPEIIVKKH